MPSTTLHLIPRTQRALAIVARIKAQSPEWGGGWRILSTQPGAALVVPTCRLSEGPASRVSRWICLAGDPLFSVR